MASLRPHWRALIARWWLLQHRSNPDWWHTHCYQLSTTSPTHSNTSICLHFQLARSNLRQSIHDRYGRFQVEFLLHFFFFTGVVTQKNCLISLSHVDVKWQISDEDTLLIFHQSNRKLIMIKTIIITIWNEAPLVDFVFQGRRPIQVIGGRVRSSEVSDSGEFSRSDVNLLITIDLQMRKKSIIFVEGISACHF